MYVLCNYYTLIILSSGRVLHLSKGCTKGSRGCPRERGWECMQWTGELSEVTSSSKINIYIARKSLLGDCTLSTYVYIYSACAHMHVYVHVFASCRM